MATPGRRSKPIRNVAVAALVLLLLGLALQVVEERSSVHPGLLRSATATATLPTANAGSWVDRTVGRVWNSLFHHDELEAEATALREELVQLRLEQSTETTRLARAASAEQLGTLLPAGADQPLPVPVLRGPTPGGRQILWVAAGSREGIAPGMIVMSEHGPIGIVEECFATSSMVQLVTDERSTWGVAIGKSKELGVLRGTGNPGGVDLHFQRTAASAKPGEPVISTAMAGSMTPAGMTFGTVEEMAKNNRGEPIARVTLPADPGEARLVFILRRERIADEPPRSTRR